VKRVHEATTCKKWRGCDKSTTKEKVVGHFGEGGREKVGRWGAVMVREKVGLAAVEYPLWAFFGQDPSEVILAWIHLPEEGINMMYRAVSWGSAKKNGALHHLASHCQTLFYHYTSQRYQVHPRLSNFAICWHFQSPRCRAAPSAPRAHSSASAAAGGLDSFSPHLHII